MFHLLDLERSGDFKTTQQVTNWASPRTRGGACGLSSTCLHSSLSGISATWDRAWLCPLHPVILGCCLALRLPTLIAGKESPGGYLAAADGHTEAGMSGRGVCWMPAQGRKAAAWLPSSFGQPRSLSCLAPWLGSRNPGSGSWFAPRHSGDARSGLRLPWEPRPGQARLTTQPPD
jgi:hypothetical protein